VTGASALDLVAAKPSDLVSQLNAAATAFWISPFVAVPVVIAFFVSPIAGVALLVPAIPLFVWLLFRDRARRSVIAFYDVNDEVETWFQELTDVFGLLQASQRKWRINEAGRVETAYQSKVNAGASALISRSPAVVSLDPPSVLKTNITVPTITVGKAALLFLPDRILVREGRTYAEVAYSALETASYGQNFIENERPPTDSQQVGTTWKFVNKSGGPDRRFNNNAQLPIMLYGRLELMTADGLFWIFDVSKADVPEKLATVLGAAPTTLGTIIDAEADDDPGAVPAIESAT
jgi:DNA polymerase-3 subunit epsilon